MSTSDLSPVGRVGRLTVAIADARSHGEVEVRIRGGTETFFARANEPLLRGQQVLCLEELGSRVIQVTPWGEREDSPLRL